MSEDSTYEYCKIWGAGEKYKAIGKEEIKFIKKCISNGMSILDLGCGIGRSSVNFFNKLNLDDCMFYLADYFDKNWKKRIENQRERSKGITLGYHKDNKPFPTITEELIKRYCTDNGMKNFEVVDMGTDRISKLKDIDLVYSFHSIGYHFPIHENIKKFNLLNITKPDARFCFGVRRYGKTWKFPTQNYRDIDSPEYPHDLHLLTDIKGKNHQDFLVFEKLMVSQN